MKSFTFAIVLLLFSYLVQSQTLTDSLLLYYPLEGNANDYSGNGFDGIANATLTTDQYGNPDAAYSFNGIDEYIDLPSDSRLKPGLPVSFSFMVSFHSFNPEDAVIFTTDFAEATHSGVWMNISSTGKLSISYGDAQGNFSINNRRTKNGNIVSPVNTWHHIIGIIRGPNDMDVYIDCNYDSGTYEGTGNGIGYTSAAGSIGRKDANFAIPPYYFKGKIDDFRYWNRALTQDNIDSLCLLQVGISNLNLLPESRMIYPNPFKSQVNLRHDVNISKILIMDSFGRLIGKYDFAESIDLNYISPGIYFINLYDKNYDHIKTEKIIKE